MRLINRLRIRRALRDKPRSKLHGVERLVRVADRRLFREFLSAPDSAGPFLPATWPKIAPLGQRDREERLALDRMSERMTLDFLFPPPDAHPFEGLRMDPKPTVIGVDLARSDSVDAFAYGVMGYMRNRRSDPYVWFLPEEGRPK